MKKLSICGITFLCLLLSLSQYGWGQTTAETPPENQSFHLSNATIVAKDIKLSATWYKKYLNIDIKEYKPQKFVKLQSGDFTLLIRQGRNVLLQSQVKLPSGKKYINGISKIGFKSNQFQMLYNKLIGYELKIIEDITEDKNLGMRYFITADPDGNKIQIFDQPDGKELMKNTAIFFSIISSDYINTMKWYENYIDFTEVVVVDRTKIHYQNLLHKDCVIFEIIHLPYESLETTEFMPLGRDLASFEQLTFKSNDGKISSFKMDNNANKISWKK